MRRKYLVAVLLLLATGIVSTLALGTLTSTLSETLLTEYTLSYDEASAVLSAPSTTPSTTTTTDDTITVSMTVTQGSTQNVLFSIQPFSGTDGTGAINADADGASYSWTVGYTTSGDETGSGTVTSGNPITFDITTSTSDTINSLEFTIVNDGLVTAYNSLVVDVSDV